MAIERSFFDLGKESDLQSYLMAARMGNDAGLTWEVVLRSKRVLLVTEAGVGKTYECQQQAKRLWQAGEPAFYLDLAGLKDNALTELLSPEEEERFER